MCFIRRGVVHGFKNLHAAKARALAVVTPGLIGPDYFREMAAVVNVAGPPDLANVKEIMLRHGLVPAPLPIATAGGKSRRTRCLCSARRAMASRQSSSLTRRDWPMASRSAGVLPPAISIIAERKGRLSLAMMQTA